MNIKNISNYNNLIAYSCKILKLVTPDVYNIFYRGGGFIMYDNQLTIISYDDRDAPFFITGIHFIEKEYTIYINIDFLKNSIISY